MYVSELTNFFSTAINDKRLTARHISMYMVLFHCWNLNHFQNPVSITRNVVMKAAKINGKATYHKCIKELQAFGYIRYQPSYHPILGSLVFMNFIE